MSLIVLAPQPSALAAVWLLDWSYQLNWVFTVIGSVLGIVLGILRIADWVRDRPMVKVNISGPWETFFEDGSRADENSYFRLEAVNTGRRPVTLTNAGFRMAGRLKTDYRWGEIFPQAGAFPAELKEGQLCDQRVLVDEVQRMFKKPGVMKLVPHFRSSTGRVFSGKPISWEWVLAQLQDASAQPAKGENDNHDALNGST